jgi:L-2,4-diaminobutyric acid acetyltransferase
MENTMTATLERSSSNTIDKIHYRTPTAADGANVWELVKETGVLDLNSSYSYLLWCKYFAETSIVAESDGEVVGFISAFLKPEEPDTVFVWQVAVDQSCRGKGLGVTMLHQLIELVNGASDQGDNHVEYCEDIHYLEATVSPSNKASQSLFRRLARDLNTEYTVSSCFSSDDFPEKGHEDELIHRIGPFLPKNKMN